MTAPRTEPGKYAKMFSGSGQIGGGKYSQMFGINPGESRSQFEEDPFDYTDESQGPGFFQTVGNIWKMLKFAKNNPTRPAEEGYGQAVWDSLKKNAGESFSKAREFVTHSPLGIFSAGPEFGLKSVAEAGKGIFNLAKNPSQVASLPTALLQGVAETPLKAITGTTVDENSGEVRPLAPDEMAHAFQQSVGFYLSLGVAAAVETKILQEAKIFNEAGKISTDAALKITSGAKKGTLGQLVGADAIAGIIAGGVQGGIGELGQEDQFQAVVGNALAFAPLGGLFALVRGRGILKEADNISTKVKIEENLENFHELALLNSLRTSPSEPLIDIIGKIEAFASSDDLLEAAIKAGLDVENGTIVRGLTPEGVKKLIPEATGEARQINLTPTLEDGSKVQKLIGSRKISPSQRLVQFESDFDKLTYIIQSQARKGKKRFYDEYLEAAKEASGLNEKEIIEHGKRVKERINDSIAKGTNQVLRTQEEIDKINNQFRVEGETKINSLTEGEKVKDYLGQTWRREGEYIIQEGSGAKYHVTSKEAQIKIGRVFNEEEIKTSAIHLTRETVQTGEGLGVGKIRAYKGAKNRWYITKEELTPEVGEFFKRTGFFPGQVVADAKKGTAVYIRSYDPKTRSFRVKSAAKAGGNEYTLKSRDLKEFTSPLISSVKSKIKGGRTELLLAGELTPQSYFSQLYLDFKQNFDLAKIPEDTWDDTMLKFLNKHGLSKNDRNFVETAFYSKIAEDVKSLSDPADVAAYEATMKSLEATNIAHRERFADQLYLASRTAEGSGMYLEALGGGAYAIKFADGSGGTLGKVTTPEEAYELINTAGEIKVPDLDGGASNPISPEIAAVGVNDKSWKVPSYNWVDQLNVGTAFSWMVPSNNFIASVDNLVEGATDFFGQVARPLQEAMNKHRVFLEGPAKPLVDHYESIRQFIKKGKFTNDQLRQVTEYIETLSEEEIIKKYLPRELNEVEIKTAEQLANSVDDVSQIVDFLNEVRSDKNARRANIGSGAYMKTFKEIAAKSQLDPKVKQAAESLITLARNSSLDVFSADAVIRLAISKQHPAAALTRAEFAGKFKMSPAQIQLARMFERGYDMGFQIFGLDPKTKLAGYTPHMRIAYAVGNDVGGISSKWVHEMHRFGEMAGDNMVRDPLELFYRYVTGGARYKSGLIDAINSATKALEDNAEILHKTPLGQIGGRGGAEGIVAKIQQHIRDMSGIPGQDIVIRAALNRFYGHMKWVPASESFVALSSLATQGGRMDMGARDLLSAIRWSEVAFGREFTRKAFFNSVPEAKVKLLQDRGILPKGEPMDLISPQSSPGSLRANTGFRKLAHIGFQASLQTQVYNRGLAGIYSATTEIVMDALRDLGAGKITKQKAYERIGLSAHTPAVQRKFDAFVNAGDPASAADWLGRWNGKVIMNHYGNNNAPIGWNTTIGRLLGQNGSYATNASQVFLDLVSRGSAKERAWRMMKFAGFNAALYGAGVAVGVNMQNWMDWPTNFIPGGGLTLSAAQNLQYANATGDWSKLYPSSLSNIGQFYIPFSYGFENWFKAYNLLNEGYFGPQVVGQAIGLKPLEE